MKIIELSIKNFGGLSNLKIMPIDGVNIFYGENEAGKSTVMAFILAMLYGLGKGEQRRRYEPWEGGNITGSMTFSAGEKEYYLNRQFGPKRSGDKTELWCKTTGEQLTIPERSEPGELIIGLSRESFINSVYIGQAGSAVKGDNREILAKLTNLAATGDETASHTEISERLSEAAAHLRSRRSEAVLPRLEKERQELIEKRADVMKRAEQADTLREEINVLKKRRERLDGELKTLEQYSQIASEVRELRELESVIARSESYEAAKEEYEALHEHIFPEGGSLTEEFIDQSHQLLDEYKQEQVVIRMKEEQLDSINGRLEEIDTAPLKKLKMLKRHSSTITEAREEYKSTKEKLRKLHREIELENTKADDKRLQFQNVLIVAGLLTAVFILLGFLQKAFFFIALIIAVLAGAYIYIQRKGVRFEGLPSDNIELANLESDLHEINRRMMPVLEDMGVEDMEQLDQELYRIRDIRDRKTSVEEERDAMLESIDSERQKLNSILGELRDKLRPFTEVRSDSQALKIISSLDKMLSKHEALEERYLSEEEAYETALDNRDIDDVRDEADALRASLGKKADMNFDDIACSPEDVEKCREDLQTTRETLASKETELGLTDADPQELNLLTSELQSLCDRISRYEFEYKAIQEAQSALDEAFESLQKDFGPMLNFRASKILSELTGGKYSSVMISGELVPSAAEPGGSIHGTRQLSGGTVDQVYLAMRLALAGILSEENLPLMMDEAFAQYDDERMSGALSYLGHENSEGRLGQILLFTCHKRVLEAAKQSGLSDGIVNLSR